MESLEKLKDYGIKGKDVYFIDVIPLIEMIWADGRKQEAELAIMEHFLFEYLEHLNKSCGYQAFTEDDVKNFVSRFLKERPDPDLLKTLRELVFLAKDYCSEENLQIKDSLLARCLDIAASSTTEYPYGLYDRFNLSEKKCYFEIYETLSCEKPQNKP
jgi:hypothetical protein